jgi:hypothetical protein
MAVNYVLLERTELNASAASVTFSNIPQSGYTDLKIVLSARQGAENAFDLTFNGNAGSYSVRRFQADGSNTSSNTASSYSNAIRVIGIVPSGSTANTFSNSEIYIPNYTSSNYKSVSLNTANETNATEAYMNLAAGLWSNTAAITSVTITPVDGSLAQYSTFSLYGIAALGTEPVIAPKASGGNITTDGTYWYHTFLTTSAFVPNTSLSCDALVVAGGGGGGAGQGGGGGAGGLLGFTSQSFAALTSYTVTVGAGGAGGTRTTTTNGKRGTNGIDSQIGALTLVKGGGGGGNYDENGTGKDGGSGGGAGCTPSASSGGTATSGQGNNGGGSGTYAGSVYGGGGGGAGAAGATGGTTAGTGGVGSSSYSSYGSATNTGQNVSGTYYYSGGGGGGGEFATTTGGNGGGASSGSAGTTNTGGGGGGSTYSGGNVPAGNGGSGIVIIRYVV